MTDPKPQLAAWNQAAYDAALAYARAGLESAEQLLRLNLATARATLDANSRAARELLAAGDSQAALATRTKLAEQQMQQAATYASSVYEIVSGMQSQLARLAEESLGRAGQSLASGAAEAAKSGPGGEAAAAALQSTVAATNAMMESITQATRQFAALSEATIKAATEQMVRGGRKD
ncbi:MAG: phasin family protein [Burkholderiales bacterium]|nr:phasin family protein [Burkholderiales bacterium]